MHTARKFLIKIQTSIIYLYCTREQTSPVYPECFAQLLPKKVSLEIYTSFESEKLIYLITAFSFPK